MRERVPQTLPALCSKSTKPFREVNRRSGPAADGQGVAGIGRLHHGQDQPWGVSGVVSDRKPRSYRSVVFALGLTCLPILGQAQEHAQSPQGQPSAEQQPFQPSQSPAPRNPIRIEIIEDQAETDARKRREAEADQREIDDLAAQQGMNAETQAINEATQRMAAYSWYQTWAVAIGTILVFASLVLTVIATWAAHKAIRVTREIGNAQLRAYMGWHRGGLTLHHRELQVAGLVVIKNFGQTPAHEMTLWVECKLLGSDEIMDEPKRPEAASGTSKSWVGPQQESTVTFGCNVTDTELEEIRESRQAFFVRGRVDYVDAFGKSHHGRFSFKMDGPEYNFVEGNVRAFGWALRPTDYGNDAT